jgi:hypothetical protein
MDVLSAFTAFAALAAGVLFFFGRGMADFGHFSWLGFSGNHLVGIGFGLLGVWIASRRSS